MNEAQKSSTEAEKQVERLESLKRMKERLSQPAQPVPGGSQIRTAAERTMERLEAMRLRVQTEAITTPPASAPPPVSSAPPPIEAPIQVPDPMVSYLLPEPSPGTVPSPDVVQAVPFEPPAPAAVPTAEALADAEPNAQADPATSVVSLGHHAFPRFEGKYKSVKLTLEQMRMLEKLFAADYRLYPGRILRIALNLWMGLPNQIPEDRELEPLARILLAGMRNTPEQTEP